MDQPPVRVDAGSGYYEVLDSRGVAGLILAEARYPAGLEFSSRQEFTSFYLSLSGEFTEVSARAEARYGSATLLFRPEARASRFKIHRRVRCFSLEFASGWAERLSGRSVALDRSVTCSSGLLLELMLRLYSEFRKSDAAAALAIEGLALELLAAGSRSRAEDEPAAPRWLRQARELLHDEFTEGWTLKEVASIVGAHPVSLARAFRRHYGSTVGEYLRKLRLEYAGECLASSEMAISEIAVSCGFVDQSHFSNAFKRATGVTPAMYRRLKRRNPV